MGDELTAFRQEAREWIAGNFPGSLKGGGGGGLSQAHARIINEELTGIGSMTARSQAI